MTRPEAPSRGATADPAGRAGATALMLHVYARRDCHLCEEMLRELERLRTDFAFELKVVDIDGDPALQRAYAGDVPVLAVAGRVLCRYRLDAGALKNYLGENARRLSG